MKELRDGEAGNKARVPPLSLEQYWKMWLHQGDEEVQGYFPIQHVNQALKLHGVYSYDMHKTKGEKVEMLKQMTWFSPVRSTLGRSSMDRSPELPVEELEADLKSLGWEEFEH